MNERILTGDSLVDRLRDSGGETGENPGRALPCDSSHCHRPLKACWHPLCFGGPARPTLRNALNLPWVVLVISICALSLATYAGTYVRAWRPLKDEARDSYNVILSASLTLLGLIVGFTFSMAGGRYDQRKNYEEAEANAIGTEWARTDLLPPAAAERVKIMLREYLVQRIAFYEESRESELDRIDAQTTQLQQQMWSVVVSVAAVQPTQIVALATSGMNDVLNSEGYTQAAWWYRIPTGAWALMGTISMVCCAMLGYGTRGSRTLLLILLPVGLSIAFYFISDIDSPRRGVIRPLPVNLIRLATSVHVR